MSLKLRSARPSDIPAILEFIRGLAEYEKLLHEFEATADRLNTHLFPAHGHPTAECILAFVDEVPAGFALFFTNFSTFLAKPGLYLEDLFVKPELRGLGIGKALLLRVAKLANERGCGRMDWTVLEWNQPAIAFYDSLGARKLEDWRVCRLAGEDLARFA
jgi:GNAT superfamily N-acetyltransferase